MRARGVNLLPGILQISKDCGGRYRLLLVTRHLNMAVWYPSHVTLHLHRKLNMQVTDTLNTQFEDHRKDCLEGALPFLDNPLCDRSILSVGTHDTLRSLRSQGDYHDHYTTRTVSI